MKKFAAILLVALLVFALVSCVDNKQENAGGDVTLPAEESAQGNVSVTGTGMTDQNGNIELPIDWFN